MHQHGCQHRSAWKNLPPLFSPPHNALCNNPGSSDEILKALRSLSINIQIIVLSNASRENVCTSDLYISVTSSSDELLTFSFLLAPLQLFNWTCIFPSHTFSPSFAFPFPFSSSFFFTSGGRWTFFTRFYCPAFSIFSTHFQQSPAHSSSPQAREATAATILLSQSVSSGLFPRLWSHTFSSYVFPRPSSPRLCFSYQPIIAATELCASSLCANPPLPRGIHHYHHHHQLFPSLTSTTCGACSCKDGGVIKRCTPGN